MLRSEHAIVRYDFLRHTVHPDRLRRGVHRRYVDAAEEMIRVYRDGVGQTRQELHRRVEERMLNLGGCPPRRISAFCKLLDQFADYQKDPARARSLRQKIFALGAELHPIVQEKQGIFDHSIAEAQQQVCKTLNCSWTEIESMMFADVIELQTLRKIDTDLTASSLLSLYNVAQTQATLYRATRMRIDASGDYKTILRQAKLAGLMHRILRRRDGRGYRFEFDGPQSSLRQTWRYGIRFAQMLPKLLSCDGWELTAWVAGPRGATFRLRVSPADGLQSAHESPDPHDSDLEARIEAAWREAPVEGWTFERESEILHQGQTVLTPDFILTHQAFGKRVFVEVVGFWTPEYLKEKGVRLSQFCDASSERDWLLIFPKENQAAASEALAHLGLPTLEIGKRFHPKEMTDLIQLPDKA